MQQTDLQGSVGVHGACCEVWTTGSGSVFLNFQKGRETCGLEAGLDAAREISRLLGLVSDSLAGMQIAIKLGERESITLTKHDTGALEVGIRRGRQWFTGQMVPAMGRELAGCIRQAMLRETIHALEKKGDVRGPM